MRGCFGCFSANVGIIPRDAERITLILYSFSAFQRYFYFLQKFFKYFFSIQMG